MYNLRLTILGCGSSRRVPTLVATSANFDRLFTCAAKVA